VDKKKIVYIGMAADLIHQGHINIIHKGEKYGEVIVGVLTDEAIASYKRKPIIPFNQRMFLLKNLKGVKKVIPQKTLDYEENLLRIKPDVVIHGNDWKVGAQKEQRKKVIKLLKKWDGKLIEPKYTKGISSTEIIKIIQKRIINSDEYEFVQSIKKQSKNKKIVYAYYCLDIIHKGHIKAMKKHREIAGDDGILIAGILTDKAIEEKKRPAIISFEERIELANAIKYLDAVVPQNTYSPIENLKTIKPNILIESTSHSKDSIKHIQKYMDSINGEVIVVPYYNGQSSTKIKSMIKKNY
jgi:cytidyltransferase-like protein